LTVKEFIVVKAFFQNEFEGMLNSASKDGWKLLPETFCYELVIDKRNAYVAILERELKPKSK
jgi:hypothetical protein